MMRRKEKANDWIRVFTHRQMYFIYKYVLMGLYKGKVQKYIYGLLYAAQSRR
jgi:hypothetical protein